MIFMNQIIQGARGIGSALVFTHVSFQTNITDSM